MRVTPARVVAVLLIVGMAVVPPLIGGFLIRALTGYLIFGLLALMIISSFAGQWVVTLLSGATLWGKLLSFGWLVIETSFGAVLVTVAYHDLRVAKEGIHVDNLANVFD